MYTNARFTLHNALLGKERSVYEIENMHTHSMHTYSMHT